MVTSSQAYIYESRFLNATASESGAGVYMVGSSLEIDGAVFEDI